MPEAKKYKAAVALFDRDGQYTPTEAVSIVKKTATKKFDESVDVAVRLGLKITGVNINKAKKLLIIDHE